MMLTMTNMQPTIVRAIISGCGGLKPVVMLMYNPAGNMSSNGDGSKKYHEALIKWLASGFNGLGDTLFFTETKLRRTS